MAPHYEYNHTRPVCATHAKRSRRVSQYGAHAKWPGGVLASTYQWPARRGPTTQEGTPLDYLPFVRAMLASASPPVLFPLVEIYDDHQQYCDGGVHEIAPLQLPIILGAETIDAIVLLAPDEPPAQPGVFLDALPMLERTLDMVLDAATVTDIKLAQTINAAVADRDHVPSALSHYRLVNLHVIQPEQVLPAAAYTFEPPVMQQMIALGRAVADRALQTW